MTDDANVDPERLAETQFEQRALRRGFRLARPLRPPTEEDFKELLRLLPSKRAQASPEMPSAQSRPRVTLVRKIVYEYVPSELLETYLSNNNNQTTTSPTTTASSKRPSFSEQIAAAKDFDYSPFALLPEERNEAIKQANHSHLSKVSTDTDGFIRIARPTPTTTQSPNATRATTVDMVYDKLDLPPIAGRYRGEMKWTPHAIADSIAARFREEAKVKAAKGPVGPPVTAIGPRVRRSLQTNNNATTAEPAVDGNGNSNENETTIAPATAAAIEENPDNTTDAIEGSAAAVEGGETMAVEGSSDVIEGSAAEQEGEVDEEAVDVEEEPSRPRNPDAKPPSIRPPKRSKTETF